MPAFDRLLAGMARIMLASLVVFPVFAEPLALDFHKGGEAVFDIPMEGLAQQFALMPGGAYLEASATLTGIPRQMSFSDNQLFVAAGAEGLLVYDVASGHDAKLVSGLKWQGEITALAVGDGHAYLSDSKGALLVIDVQDHARIRQLASFPMAVVPEALALDNGRLYWTGGNRFGILDVSRPETPRSIATMPLQDRTTAIQIREGFAYLAQPLQGLLVLDVHDPAAIRQVARFPGQVKDVFVANGNAYLANGETGLTILDVADPSAPRWVGSANNLGDVLSLRYDDGYVTLINDRSEVSLIDVQRPKLPRVIDTYAMDCPLHALAFSGRQAWVVTDANLDTIDFSAPPPNVSSLGANFGGSRRAVIRDGILYVADWFSGLHMYDISDPHAPRHLSNYHTGGSSKGVLVRDQHVFVADDDHGVQILDISDPKHPRKVSQVATPGLAYTMKLVGDYLYLADHRGGFQIISVADIGHPTIVGSASTTGKVWAVAVENDRAWLAADSDGLVLFDVSDPARPTQLAAYDLGGAAEDVVIRNNLAYVTSFENGLHIFDISQPLQAKEIGYLATPGNARGIQLVGDLAYIADWVSGIQVVNIADPVHPAIVGSYDTDGRSWGVLVQGRFAYVLDWWGGIIVLDVSDPAAPSLAGAYHARGMTRDVVTRDSVAYVADGSNGLQVFDIKNPLNPIWMAGVDLPGDAQHVCLDGKKAYIESPDAEAEVDITNPFEPRQRAPQATGVAVKRHCIELQADDPRLEKLPPMDIIRRQGGLLATYSRSTGISLYDFPALNLLSRFNPGVTLVDMQFSNGHLYASSGENPGLFDIDISNPRHPMLKTAYSMPGRPGKFSVFSGSVFMAGNQTLSELQLLPKMSARMERRNGRLNIKVPKDMPLGSYDLLAIDPVTGKHTLRHDVLRIVMPVPKKPAFTLQDLERELRKRGLKPHTYP